jgi:glucose-6-phosphate 1-dehydrogenase
MNRKTADGFARLLEQARKERLVGDRFSEAWFLGIANRVHADPKSKSVSEIVHKFSAYHEFEEVKLTTALQHPEYNPQTHVNDLLDAEQLVYLAAPTLCFLTADRGFERVTKSEQAARIVIVPPMEVSDAHKAEAVLRKLLTD